jgi:ABC-2 type transport system permease protein
MPFIIQAVSRGAGGSPARRSGGTLDVVLVTSVSPTSLVLQKAAALATSVCMLAIVLFVATLALSPVFDMHLRVTDVASGAVAMALIGIEFGFVALAVGAVTGRRGIALAVGGSLAVASCVLYTLGLLVDGFERWQPLSPFHQVVADGPLGGGIPASFAWPVVVAVLLVGCAVPVFSRRDIRTA